MTPTHLDPHATLPIAAPKGLRQLDALPPLTTTPVDIARSETSGPHFSAIATALELVRAKVPHLAPNRDVWHSALANTSLQLADTPLVSHKGLTLAARVLAYRDGLLFAGDFHFIEAFATCRSAAFDHVAKSTMPAMLAVLDKIMPMHDAELSPWHATALTAALLANVVPADRLVTEVAPNFSALGTELAALRRNRDGYTLAATALALKSRVPKRLLSKQRTSSPLCLGSLDAALRDRAQYNLRTVWDVLDALFDAAGENVDGASTYAHEISGRSSHPLASIPIPETPAHAATLQLAFVDAPPVCQPHGLRERFTTWMNTLAEAPQLSLESREHLALTLGAHQAGEPQSPTLLIGPPGCGKSHLLDLIARHASWPCIRIDTTQLTQNGFKGLNLNDAFQRYGSATNMLISDLERAIVVLDEFDKIAAPIGAEDATYSTKAGAQHALLGLLAGTGTLAIAEHTLQLGKMLVICAGAFHSLEGALIGPAELQKYGFLPELADRVQRTVYLQHPTRDTHLTILRARFAPRPEDRVSRPSGMVRVEFPDSTLHALATIAHTTGWTTRRLFREAEMLRERAVIAALREGRDAAAVYPDDICWTT